MADQTVARWQATLDALGFDPGPIDGIWGSRTLQAVREFRAAAGLDPEGGTGSDFEAALFRATQSRGVIVDVPNVTGTTESQPSPGGGGLARPSMAPTGFPTGKTLGVLLLVGAVAFYFFGRRK